MKSISHMFSSILNNEEQNQAFTHPNEAETHSMNMVEPFTSHQASCRILLTMLFIRFDDVSRESSTSVHSSLSAIMISRVEEH